MSEISRCPFCGGEASVHRCEHAFHDAKIRCAGCQAEGPIFDVDDGEANEAGRNEAEAIAAWNRRTPAPEGEAWRTVPVEPTEAMIEAAHALWGEGTGVNYVQLEPEDFYAAMLAASPVVPVGVSRAEQRPLAEAIYRQVAPLLAECSEPNPEDYISAIIAALRPTDTGRE